MTYQKIEYSIRGLVQSPLHHPGGLVLGIFLLRLLPTDDVVVGIPLARLQVGQPTPAEDIASEGGVHCIWVNTE